MFDELVVGKATGLWQTIHATSDFDVYETVVNERAKVVFIHDDVRDHINWDTHIFVASGPEGYPFGRRGALCGKGNRFHPQSWIGHGCNWEWGRNGCKVLPRR